MNNENSGARLSLSGSDYPLSVVYITQHTDHVRITLKQPCTELVFRDTLVVRFNGRMILWRFVADRCCYGRTKRYWFLRTSSLLTNIQIPYTLHYCVPLKYQLNSLLYQHLIIRKYFVYLLLLFMVLYRIEVPVLFNNVYKKYCRYIWLKVHQGVIVSSILGQCSVLLLFNTIAIEKPLKTKFCKHNIINKLKLVTKKTYLKLFVILLFSIHL